MKKIGRIAFLLAIWLQTTANPTFLVLADIHYDHLATTNAYGSDTGQKLWHQTLTKTAELVKEQHPKFIIVLGDLPSHSLLPYNRKTDLQQVLQDLRTTLGQRNLPIYLVPGNNDSPKGNYHSFSDEKGQSLLQLDRGWPALNSNERCEKSDTQPCVIDGAAKTTFGFYSVYPLGSRHRLRLIVLNSVIFTNRNYTRDDGVLQIDAAKKELDWLATELKEAKIHKDAVIIALHIPPGYDAFSKMPFWKTLSLNNETLLNAFIDLVNRNRTNLRLILSAHTHMDEIRKIYNPAGDFAALDIAVPSVSPIHKNNPSLALFYYDAKNYRITDVKIDYTTPDATHWGNESYTLRKTYTCKTPSLSACIASLPLDKLKNDMNQVYFTKSPGHASEDWDSIDSSILVTPTIDDRP